MTDLNALTAANAQRWAKAKLTRNFVSIAKSLVAAKVRYQTVETLTSVPWFVIAVIHEREADQKWDTHLGQGDPLDKTTTHVPIGEPAFATWEEGAYDALVNCHPHAARWKDWTPGGVMTLIETYNGMGYASHGVPSPYVWSGTDQYKIGKITRDHGPIEPIVDIQPGCAALIKTMIALDPTISFGKSSVPIPIPQPRPVPPPEPPTSLWTLLLSIFRVIFGGK